MTGDTDDDASTTVTIKRTTAQGDLDDETLYHIQFKAVNKNPANRGNADSLNWSKAGSFTTGEATKPGMVDGLTAEQATDASVGDQGLNLLWNKPTSGSDVDNYVVQRKIGSGQWLYPSNDARRVPGDVTSYTDPQEWKTGDDVRTYRVAAKNDEGMSDYVEVMYPRDPAADHAHAMASGTIGGELIAPEEEATVDASTAFTGDIAMYGAVSGDAGIATASAAESTGVVTITGVAFGSTTVTVTATDRYGSKATQGILVTVTTRRGGRGHSCHGPGGRRHDDATSTIMDADGDADTLNYEWESSDANVASVMESATDDMMATVTAVPPVRLRSR